MNKNYYLLCVGDNWDKVMCDSVRKNYVEDKDIDEYDTIYLKSVIQGTVTERRRSFLKGYYSVSVPGLVDSPIYVEVVDGSIQDVVTGTEFPIFKTNNNENVLFHYCYPKSEKHVAEFLKSLNADDIKRYKMAMLELRKAIRKANSTISNDNSYIEQFKKKYR